MCIRTSYTYGPEDRRGSGLTYAVAGLALVLTLAAAAGGWVLVTRDFGSRPANSTGGQTSRAGNAPGEKTSHTDAQKPPSQGRREPEVHEPEGSRKRVRRLMGKLYPSDRRAKTNRAVKQGLDKLEKLRGVAEDYRRTKSGAMPDLKSLPDKTGDSWTSEKEERDER